MADRVERFIKKNGHKIILQYGAFLDQPYDAKAVWDDERKIEKIVNMNRE